MNTFIKKKQEKKRLLQMVLINHKEYRKLLMVLLACQLQCPITKCSCKGLEEIPHSENHLLLRNENYVN